jgi:hypothetical protein
MTNSRKEPLEKSGGFLLGVSLIKSGKSLIVFLVVQGEPQARRESKC